MKVLMMIYSLPFIGAFLGWITNYIAVKMLFYPREKVRVLFWDIQGIFPKRQPEIARKLSKMISDELLSLEDIKEIIKQPSHISHIKESLEVKIDTYLSEQLPDKFPIMSMFMGRKTKVRIKDSLLIEAESVAPDMMDRYLQNIENELDIEKMISDKVVKLSPAKLEDLMMQILKKEFVFIEWVGAVVGLLIGLVQMFLVMYF